MTNRLRRAALAALLGVAVTGSYALSCTSDPECDDGLVCNGTETCNLGTCQSGTPVTCPPPGQCEVSVDCQEPSGSCVATPKPDFVLCDDGQDCTLSDTCQGGVCVSGPGGDSDGDGDCDADEVSCNCNPNDGQEVCRLPNRLVGRIGTSTGEVLMEWYSPTARRVHASTDDACATAGQCVNKRCTRGKVRDVCAVDADCNQPPLTCRLILNWPDLPDLTLDWARIGRTDIPGFTPPARGCSRKADVSVDPERTTTAVRLKAGGTVDTHPRHDRDTFRLQPQ